MKKEIVLSILLILLLLTLSSCETGRGLGKDIENTGENVQETIDKNR